MKEEGVASRNWVGVGEPRMGLEVARGLAERGVVRLVRDVLVPSPLRTSA